MFYSRTAVIYFGNQTFVTIGPIEGDAHYRTFMRGYVHPPTRGWRAYCEALPSSLWLFQRTLCPRNPDLDAVQSLMKALQLSVASRLGTTFCFAEIILPDPHNQAYQRQMVDAALANLELKRSFPILNAATMAVAASALGRPADPNLGARVVLAVDHSTYGLNVALMTDKDGIIVTLRQQHDISLTADEAVVPRRWETLESIVPEVTQPPFGKSILNRPRPGRIQKLVVYGDMADMPTLSASLRKIIGRDATDNASRFEPLFASAISAARNSYDIMRDLHFTERPSRWCGCWSTLYYDQCFDL